MFALDQRGTDQQINKQGRNTNAQKLVLGERERERGGRFEHDDFKLVCRDVGEQMRGLGRRVSASGGGSIYRGIGGGAGGDGGGWHGRALIPNNQTIND